MEPENKSNKNIGIIIGVIVLSVVGVVTFFVGKKSTQLAQASSVTPQVTIPVIPNTTHTPPVPVQIPPVDTTKKVSYAYKNGTYSATGTYDSPGGQDTLGVKITLANDIVTDVSIVEGASDPISQKYQDKFVSGYKQYVVGKKIVDINLTKVSGSSLTPTGFNDALTQIKSQAKA